MNLFWRMMANDFRNIRGFFAIASIISVFPVVFLLYQRNSGFTRPSRWSKESKHIFQDNIHDFGHHAGKVSIPSSCSLTETDRRSFPHCADKIRALQSVWKKDPCLQYHRIEGDQCSIMFYLYKVSKVCPRKPFPYIEGASIRTDQEGLMRILLDPNSRQAYAWIRLRIRQFWDHWVRAIKRLMVEQEMRGRKRKHILLYLGFASKKSGTRFIERQFKGGPLGELVQWTDLIITLYILGHNITVTSETEQLLSLAKSIESPKSACRQHGEFPYDLIYTDYMGYGQMKTAFKGILKHKCKFRILDTFGTEPKYNLHGVVPPHSNPWAGHNFQLKQIFTTFPHTADNSVMGFVMQALINDTEAMNIPRRHQVLLYGKTSDYLKGKEKLLKVFRDAGLEIHATLSNDRKRTIPSFVINHGIVNGTEVHRLLRQSKIYVGLGYPVEGPAPLEAVANGAVYLNPKHIPPIGKGASGWGVKPTSRELTSQQTYTENFMGEPHVYTVDISNINEIKKTVDRILKLNKFESYLPFEFTPEGMLQRMNAYIENQQFCKWPPEGVVTLVLGNKGQTCSQTCSSYDRICEPVYFQDANWKDSLISAGAVCTTTERLSDVFYPAFDVNSNNCILQATELLFSCAESKPNLRRLCPCRTFSTGQHALCPGCVDVVT